MAKQKKNGLGSLLLAIALALTIRWGIAEAYVIPSGSMLPSLLIHDHIFVNKFVYGLRVPFSKSWLVHFKKLEHGEVVVFKDPRDNNTFLIKRIIGLAGDKLEYRNNQLFLNGALVEEITNTDRRDLDWVSDEELENQKANHLHLTAKLGSHEFTVLHSENHLEREAGPIVVPEDSFFVLGDHRDNSADSRYWGFAPVENVLGKAMFVWLSCAEPLPGIGMGCNPTTIRWGRFFHWVN